MTSARGGRRGNEQDDDRLVLDDVTTAKLSSLSLDDGHKSSPLPIPRPDPAPSTLTELLPEHAVSSVSTSSGTLSDQSPSSSGERTAETDGGLVPGDLDTARDERIEPPFPSPSSTFRPQPPDFDVASTLDERIASIKEAKARGRTRSTDRVSAVPADKRQASRSRDRTSNATTPRTRSRATSVKSAGSAAVPAAERYRVIVRDYAFPRDDPRFSGLPHPDDLSRVHTPYEASPLGNDAFASSGSSAFSWGFVTTHGEELAGSDSSQPYGSEDVVYEQQFDDEYGDFVPGIYKALYDFEPELESEMALVVDELVIVSLRQCAGWVQASRVIDGETTGEVGLVPENYLHLIARDDSLGADGHFDEHHAPFDNEHWQVREGDDSAAAGAAAAEKAGGDDDPSTPKGDKQTDTTTEAGPIDGGEEEELSTPSKKRTPNEDREVAVPVAVPPMHSSASSH